MDLLDAVAALKTFPAFQHASLRLLTDLVDAAKTPEISAGAGAGPEFHASSGLYILEGTVELRVPIGQEELEHEAGSGKDAQPDDPSAGFDARSAHPNPELGCSQRVVLRGGGFVGGRSGGLQRPMSARVSKTATVRAVSLETEELARGLQAAPVLGRSLGPLGVRAILEGPMSVPDKPCPATLFANVRAYVINRLASQRLHLILLSAADQVEAPLGELGKELACSLAAQFDEPAAVAVVGDRHVAIKIGDRQLTIPLPVDGQHLDAFRKTLKDEVVDATPGTQLRHVIFVPAAGERAVPDVLAGLFHRVAHLTRTMPDEMPAHLEKMLIPQARSAEGDGPLFSSFVASVLVDSSTRVARRGLLPRLPLPDPLGLRDMKLRWYDVQLDNLPGSAKTSPRRGWRVRRDHCRLRLNVAKLDDPGNAESIARWARALTNRQVGLALSGGGASSYRLVPFLKRLEELNVPVDVVSGVSGGALLGAYYCTEGTRGLDRCTERGPLFQVVLAANILDSQYTESVINWDLGRARIESLTRRFVPLATALTLTAPPAACAITIGTVGAAVRASGAFPGVLGPANSGGRRFVDGGASTLVPAYVLPDHGADFTIATYSVPAPASRNPLRHLPGAEWLYRNTVVGRAIDLWVASSYFLERASAEAGKAAHVYVAAGDSDLPLAIEVLQFAGASRIATQFEGAKEAADECARRWEEFWSASA